MASAMRFCRSPDRSSACFTRTGCVHMEPRRRAISFLSSFVGRARRLARTALRYAPKVDAHVFRDRALRADAVPVDELRHEVAGLEEGDWIWVDAVEPSPEDLTALQRQLDLHDLAVEDVQN